MQFGKYLRFAFREITSHSEGLDQTKGVINTEVDGLAVVFEWLRPPGSRGCRVQHSRRQRTG